MARSACQRWARAPKGGQGHPDPQRLARPRRPWGQVLGTAALAVGVLWGAGGRHPASAGRGPHAAGGCPAGGVAWALYRRAAQRLLVQGLDRAVRLPLHSPLRSAWVCWPDGSVLRVAPGLLAAGLGAAPTSPSGRLARSGLRAIAAAPALPAAVGPPTPRLVRALRAVLQQPAFAASRADWWWRLRQAVLRGVAGVWAYLAAVLRRGVARAGRGVLLGGGILAALAVLGGTGALLGRAWEAGGEPAAGTPSPSGSAGGRPPRLQEAEAALVAGDAARAAGLALQLAMELVARQAGLRLAPGWTVAELGARAGMDLGRDWPSLAEAAGFHEAVVFGGAAPGGALPVRRLLAELHRRAKPLRRR